MMKKIKLFNKRILNTNYDDPYEDFATDWQEKAERLQARRWRKIKHQLV